MGIPLLYELLVPATDEQLASVGGSVDRYDRELRPDLVVRVIADNQDAGIEPTLWKVEGLDTVEAAQAVAVQARAGDRDTDLIVLGRDAPVDRLDQWLRVAAQVDAFVGFAIGRSIWEDPINDWAIQVWATSPRPITSPMPISPSPDMGRAPATSGRRPVAVAGEHKRCGANQPGVIAKSGWDDGEIAQELHLRVLGNRRADRRKQKLASLSQAAADDDKGEVEQRCGRCDGDADCAASPVEGTDSDLVARTRIVGERACGDLAGRPPTVFDRPCRDCRSAGDSFQTPAAATWARRASGLDHDMADVPAIAGAAVDDFAGEHQTTTDAGRDDHAEHVVDADTGTAPMFSSGETNRVVVQPNRQAREPVGKTLPQRKPTPARDIQRRYLTGWPSHRPTTTNADRRDIAQTRQRLDRCEQRRPDSFGIRGGRRRRPRTGDNATVSGDDTDGDFRATDVDGEHRTLGHETPLSPS